MLGWERRRGEGLPCEVEGPRVEGRSMMILIRVILFFFLIFII